MTSRKQRALEERYRKPPQSFSEARHSKDQLRIMMERTEKRHAEEHWEKTRPCTLEDITKHLDDAFKGMWFYRGFGEQKNWEKEREEILTIAYTEAQKEYVSPQSHIYNPWFKSEDWETLYKKHAVKEWKRRQTKLYKALK